MDRWPWGKRVRNCVLHLMQHVASEYYMQTDVYLLGVRILDRVANRLGGEAASAYPYRLGVVALLLAFKFEDGFECGAPPPFVQLSMQKHWTQMAAALDARVQGGEGDPTTATLLARYECAALRALEYTVPASAAWKALMEKHPDPEQQHVAAVVLRYATFLVEPHAFSALARVVDSLVLQRALSPSDVGGQMLLAEFRAVLREDDFPIDTGYLQTLCPQLTLAA
jgi:hypothetical protein